MTQDCLNTHILYTRYLFIDKMDNYLTKLNIGKQCKEGYKNLRIVREYMKSYCSYQPFEDTVTYAYSFEITRVGEDTVDIIINIGLDTFTYTGTGDLEEINTYFITEALASSNYTFEARTIDDILYIYSFDNSLTFATATTVSTSDSDEATITETNLENSYCTILDELNCLTTEQLCCMIQHGYSLLQDCNC